MLLIGQYLKQSRYTKIVKYKFKDGTIYTQNEIPNRKRGDSALFDHQQAFVVDVIDNDTTNNRLVTLYVYFLKPPVKKILPPEPRCGLKVGDNIRRDGEVYTIYKIKTVH